MIVSKDIVITTNEHGHIVIDNGRHVDLILYPDRPLETVLMRTDFDVINPNPYWYCLNKDDSVWYGMPPSKLRRWVGSNFLKEIWFDNPKQLMDYIEYNCTEWWNHI